jgi:hypothetical protein
MARDNRLIGQPELVLLQRIAQVFLDPAAALGILVEVARIEAELAPSPPLAA